MNLACKVERANRIVSKAGLAGTKAELMRFKAMVDAGNPNLFDIEYEGIPALRTALSKECASLITRMDEVAKEAQKNIDPRSSHIVAHPVANIQNGRLNIREATGIENDGFHAGRFYDLLGLKFARLCKPKNVFELHEMADKVRNAERILNGILDHVEKRVRTTLNAAILNFPLGCAGNGRASGV